MDFTNVVGNCDSHIELYETASSRNVTRKYQTLHAGILSEELNKFLTRLQTEMTNKGWDKNSLENKLQESNNQGSDENSPKEFKDDNEEIDKKGVIRRNQ